MTHRKGSTRKQYDFIKKWPTVTGDCRASQWWPLGIILLQSDRLIAVRSAKKIVKIETCQLSSSSEFYSWQFSNRVRATSQWLVTGRPGISEDLSGCVVDQDCVKHVSASISVTTVMANALLQFFEMLSIDEGRYG